LFSGLVTGEDAAKFGLSRSATSPRPRDLPYAAFRVRAGGPVDVDALTRDPRHKFVGYVSASRNGRRVVFVNDTSPIKPDGQFAQRDVFMVEGGRSEQISDIAGALHSTHISVDGSRVAVLENLGPDIDELYVIDVATRSTRHVPLRERLLKMTSNGF
jgi:hypothetical protein